MDGKQVNILTGGGLSGRFSAWMGIGVAIIKRPDWSPCDHWRLPREAFLSDLVNASTVTGGIHEVFLLLDHSNVRGRRDQRYDVVIQFHTAEPSPNTKREKNALALLRIHQSSASGTRYRRRMAIHLCLALPGHHHQCRL